MTTPPPIPRSEVHVYAGEDLRGGVPGALRFTAFYRDLVHVGRFDHTSDEAKAQWIIDFAVACGTDPMHMGWMFHKIEQAAEEALRERYRIERFDNRIAALERRADETDRVTDYLQAKVGELQAKVDELQTQVTSLYRDETRFAKYEAEQKAILERLNRQAKAISLLRDGGAK
jgi:uncharacterized coiled-coil protein SlyX